MRRSHVAAVVGCAFLVPYTILLCGGRSLLADRVAALEAVVNEQLVVVDANGTVLGAVFDAQDWENAGGTQGGTGTVVLDLESLPLLPVHVKRSSIFGTRSYVVFASPDCSGDPFFEANPGGYGSPVLPYTMVVGQGASLIFYSDVDAQPQTLTPSVSTMDWRGVCFPNNPNTFVAVRGARASLQPFAPPYAVLTRGELVSP